MGAIQKLCDGVYLVTKGVFAQWVNQQPDPSIPPDWIGLQYTTVSELFDDALKLSERFNSGDQFSQSLQNMFVKPHVFDDEWFWYPYKDNPKLYEILGSWSNWKQDQNITGDWMHSIDCDDFARLFQEYCNFKLRVNTSFRVWGMLEVEYLDTGETDNEAHAFNALLLPLNYNYNDNTVVVAVVIVEPQTSEAQLPNAEGVAVFNYGNARVTYKPYIVFG